jgi:hypothetical protein
VLEAKRGTSSDNLDRVKGEALIEQYGCRWGALVAFGLDADGWHPRCEWIGAGGTQSAEPFFSDDDLVDLNNAGKENWRGLLIPEELWGSYDCPGWAANGQQDAGFEPNPIEAKGAIYFEGFFNLVLGLRALLDPERDPAQPIEIVYDDNWRFPYSHSGINAILAQDFAAALEGQAQGLCCEIHKLWPL